jgi:enamine deaminase RidA (YjgF/YER057c/UK114 family)
VVKLNYYVVGQQDLDTVRKVRQSYFAGDPPATTLVFVSGLADPSHLIEVDAIAVVDST